MWTFSVKLVCQNSSLSKLELIFVLFGFDLKQNWSPNVFIILLMKYLYVKLDLNSKIRRKCVIVKDYNLLIGLQEDS